MRKTRLAAAWLAAVLGAAAWAGAETFPLEYKPLYEKAMSYSRVCLTALSARPDGVAIEPKYGAEPLYASFPFGVDGKVISIIKCKPGRGGYGWYAVSVPDSLRGKLTLIPEVSPTGPFEWKVKPLVLEIVDS